LLLSRKQVLALQTALYQYAQNANISSDNEDDNIRNLYIKDLKNASYVMGIIKRQLHASIEFRRHPTSKECGVPP